MGAEARGAKAAEELVLGQLGCLCVSLSSGEIEGW